MEVGLPPCKCQPRIDVKAQALLQDVQAKLGQSYNSLEEQHASPYYAIYENLLLIREQLLRLESA